jgi:hypothetical protein
MVAAGQLCRGAAARYDLVRSNASKIRMVSSQDFTIPTSVGSLSPSGPGPPMEGCLPDWGDLVAACGEIPWPPVGTFLAAYGEVLMAADRGRMRRAIGSSSSPSLLSTMTSTKRASLNRLPMITGNSSLCSSGIGA